MPAKQMKMRFASQAKKNIDKSNYNPKQNFCCDCDQPINENCHNSNVMNGKCGRCYRMNFKENERRCMNKNRTRDRKSQRNYKFVSQQY